MESFSSVTKAVQGFRTFRGVPSQGAMLGDVEQQGRLNRRLLPPAEAQRSEAFAHGGTEEGGSRLVGALVCGGAHRKHDAVWP